MAGHELFETTQIERRMMLIGPPGWQPLTLREEPRRDLTTRSLQLRSSTVDREARTVEAVIATERPTQAMDLSRWEVIDEILLMRGVQLPASKQIVLLDSHAHSLRDGTVEEVRGSIRSIRVKGDRLIGVVHFADDEASERAWRKVEQGHLTDISTGNKELKTTVVPARTSSRVSGKTYTAGDKPLYIRTKWEPREGSLVAIGADPTAKIREEQSGPLPQNKNHWEGNMPKQLRFYLGTLGLRADATDEDAQAFLDGLEGDRLQMADTIRTLFDKQPPPDRKENPNQDAAGQTVRQQAGDVPADNQNAPAPVDVDAVRSEAAIGERRRIARMRELAGDDVPEDIVTRSITEGWDEARASREFLTAIRGNRQPPVGSDAPAIHSRSHETDCTREALSAGLMIRCNLRMIDPQATEATRTRQEQLAEQGERYRDMAMIDVCREAVRLDGGRVDYNRDETIRTAVSGSSLDSIFTTSVNAKLMETYEQYGDSTEGWVGVEDVPNFMTNERIGLGKMGGLKVLPRGDTAEHADRSDDEETYSIARFAKQFVVDEQDIIDDRLRALLEWPAELGLAAARLRPDLVYSLINGNGALGADSIALFHGSHSNLTTAALSAAALKAGMIAMAKQTDNSVNLNLMASWLIVPQDLLWTARELVHSAQINKVGDEEQTFGTKNVITEANLKIACDNRIGAAGITNPVTEAATTGSATNWYLSAGPRRTIVVGYRSGTGRRPQLRSFQLKEGQWGIGWDVNMDIGAKALDYRGLHKSSGGG